MDAEPRLAPSGAGEAAAAWSRFHRTRVGRWSVRHREAGRGPALVLVHGLGVSADYWHRNGPALAAEGLRVLAPDLPGFGRTHGPDEVLGVSEQVAALRRWAEGVGVTEAVFVGHSLSCQLLLELAAEQPGLVRGLALAGPTGDPRPRRMLHQAWGLARDIPREPPKLVLAAGLAYLQAGPVRVWRTWRGAGKRTPMPLLPRVSAPTVVLVGTRDPIVRPAFAEALAAGLPRGRLVWVPGGTHAVHFSRPAEFNREVRELLASSF